MTKRILSSRVGALLTATVFLVVLTGAPSAHEHITQDEFEQAARDGKLKNTGLKLKRRNESSKATDGNTVPEAHAGR